MAGGGFIDSGFAAEGRGGGGGGGGSFIGTGFGAEAGGIGAAILRALGSTAGGSHLQPSSSSRLLNSNLHRTVSAGLSRGGVEQNQRGKAAVAAGPRHHHHHHGRRVLQKGDGGGSSPLQKVGGGGVNLLDAYLSVPGRHVPGTGAEDRGGGKGASYRRQMSGPAADAGWVMPAGRGASPAEGEWGMTHGKRYASGPAAEAVRGERYASDGAPGADVAAPSRLQRGVSGERGTVVAGGLEDHATASGSKGA